MDSILNSVKKQLGIVEEYTHFDPELILLINSAFFVLNELGVGPEEPFTITDQYDTWDSFLGEKVLPIVKTYIPLKVKLMWDTPTNAALIEEIKKVIEEHEFRMMVICREDSGSTSLSFMNTVYYGVAAEPASLDFVFFHKLTSVITTSANRTFTVTAGEEDYIWYCVPVNLGTCEFNVGGFNGGFTLKDTITRVNDANKTEQYYIYRSDYPNLGTTTVKVS